VTQGGYQVAEQNTNDNEDQGQIMSDV